MAQDDGLGFQPLLPAAVAAQGPSPADDLGFQPLLPVAAGAPPGPTSAGGATAPDDGLGFQPAPDPIGFQPLQPPTGLVARGRAYGPVVGETHHDAMFGPTGNALGPNDVALSPDYQKEFPLGSYVMANGAGPYRVSDSSFISPGRPNFKTIEFRDTPTPPDYVTLTPADGSSVDASQIAPPAASSPPAPMAPFDKPDPDIPPDFQPPPVVAAPDTSTNGAAASTPESQPAAPTAAWPNLTALRQGRIAPSSSYDDQALLAFGLGAARATPGVAAGTGLASALEGPNAAVSAFTGPAAPLTMAGLNVLEFLGGMIIGNRVAQGGEKVLAPHSQMIQDAQAAAAQHPLAEMAGEQVPMLPFVARSAQGFYEIAKNADTASAAARTIAKVTAGGAAGGAAIETLRPQIESGLNTAGAQLGFTPQQIQQPDVRSYLENMAIGAALSGEAARSRAPRATRPQPFSLADVRVPQKSTKTGESNAIPVTTTGEVGSHSEGIQSPGGTAESSGVGQSQQGPQTADARASGAPDQTAAAGPVSTLRHVAISAVDTPAQGDLNAARAGKKQAFARVQEIGEQVRRLGPKAGNLRLELLKAKSEHRTAVAREKVVLDTIEKRARELGQTTRKLRLAADRDKAGFLNPDLLQGAANVGRKIYKSGMDFAAWSAEMVRSLGAKIRAHLEAIWNSITGQNILPGQRERGGASLGPSKEDIEGAANDPRKMREHIATVQRMEEVQPTTKQIVESWYSPITLKEVNDRANSTIDQLGLDKAREQFIASRKTDANALALGHHLALRYDAQGDNFSAAAVRDSMAERLTTPAQSLWYISTIAKTSPEGLIREAQRTVADVVNADPKKTQLLAEIDRLQKELANIKDPKTRQATTELTIRNLAKVNQRGQKMSAGVLDQLLRDNAAGTLSPTDLGDAIAKNLGMPRVTQANIDKIKAAQRLYAQADAANDPIMRLRRGAEMMDSVYGLVPRSFWDKVRATSVISMILHGKLPVRIGFSNAVRMAGQTAVDSIENVPRDLGNVFTGRKTVTADQLGAIIDGLRSPYTTYKSGYDDARIRGLSTLPAFREGVKTLISLASLTTRGMMELNDMSGRAPHTFSSRFGRMAEDAVTLVHNVVPYAFWNAAYKSSLVRQMRIAGLAVPTEAVINNARLDANRAIFQNDTVGYRMLKGLRNTLDLPTNLVTKGKYGFGTATVPFAKVPAALLSEGSTWTPIGFIKAGWEGIGRPLAGQEFRPKELADNLIKATIGTGSTVLAGYWLAKLGVLTGAPNEDKDLEAMMKSLGWGAYKLNLSELKRRFLSGDFVSKTSLPQAGDTIVNYNWAEPVAFGVAMGADIAHSAETRARLQQKGKIAPGEMVSAAMAGVGSLFENPLVQGVQQLATNLGEKQYAKLFADIVGNVPGNFVPSLVRQTSQQMDNTVRELRAGGPLAVEVARIEAQIPGLSQKYPPRYDVFGEAVKRQNYGNVSLVNTFFNPAQVSQFKANPEVAELMKIWNATGTSVFPRAGDNTIMITRPDTITRATPAGRPTQVQLDNQQLATYQRYVGVHATAIVTRLIASPAWAAALPEQRAATVTEVLAAVNRQAKIELFGDSPVKTSMGSLTSKPSAHVDLNVWDASTIMNSRQNPQLRQLVQPGANQ